MKHRLFKFTKEKEQNIFLDKKSLNYRNCLFFFFFFFFFAGGGGGGAGGWGGVGGHKFNFRINI